MAELTRAQVLAKFKALDYPEHTGDYFTMQEFIAHDAALRARCEALEAALEAERSRAMLEAEANYAAIDAWKQECTDYQETICLQGEEIVGWKEKVAAMESKINELSHYTDAEQVLQAENLRLWKVMAVKKMTYLETLGRTPQLWQRWI